MARGIAHFPLKATIYDASGAGVAEHRFGNLPRDHASLLDVSAVLAEKGRVLPSGYGHVELTYDFEAGREADGWMHALFRYRDRASGHVAESSFGSHMFNSVLVYKNEPQSYSGPAPGLTTRLFLRIGQKPYDTLCHLIYPASTPWHAKSDTALILTSNRGEEVARAHAAIPCGGSLSLAGERDLQGQGARSCGRGRLRHHPRHHLPAVRLSRARPGRRVVQPRPYVRVLTVTGRHLVPAPLTGPGCEARSSLGK